jgi:hypothetical protein
MIEERRNAIRDAAMASLQAGAPLADIIADAVELGLNWTATGSGPGEDVDWKRIVFPGTSGGALPSVRYEVTCTTHGLVGMSAPVTSDASITDRRVLTINALNALNTAHAEDCR